jgi:small subunit ribosomal protein S15
LNGCPRGLPFHESGASKKNGAHFSNPKYSFTFAPAKEDPRDRIWSLLNHNTMSTYLSPEKTAGIFEKYAGNSSNTGSVEGQIALFTYRIQSLSQHLTKNHKDHSCRRSLLRMVGKRKQLLNYLAEKDINKYRKLTEELGIRK